MSIKKYSVILKKDMTIGDKYVLTQYIDEGSYGYVWQAVRREDGMIVALKIPKNQEKGDATLSEGKKLILTNHPNIVQIYWMGRVDGIFVIEMEYCKGHPLSKELTEHGIRIPRTFEKVYKLFDKILDGLEFMHNQKMSHGDLKPDNILIDEDDLKLTDFGSSRLIEDIFVKSVDSAGTWAYMAPEVAGSSKRYINSDIYSLGVILYQFLTGRTPHDTLIQVLHNIPFARPCELNENVSAKMEQVVMKALEREPKRRFQTVSEFRRAFGEAMEEQAQQVVLEKTVPVIPPKKTRDALEIAVINCKLKKYSLAEKVLREEIANGNELPDILLQLAYVYYRTGRLFDGLNLLQRINMHNIEDSRLNSFKDTYYYLIARVLFAMKRYEEALRTYRTLYQISSENLDYRYRLAVCCGICGFEDEAIHLLEIINEETPGIWAVVKKLGLAYDQKKDFDRARGYFKYSLRLRPDDEQVKKKLEMYDFYL